ncbi:MAG: flagellar motor protein MotB [Desulfocapsaceae bacterium]|jgi:chemotaxis protein MotB|nr:flagellar motor protein MotB [Desulfocapsaceae bacterium]
MAETTQLTPDKQETVDTVTDKDILPVVPKSEPVVSGGGDLTLYSSSLFLADESPFRSSHPKVSHWSIAWSDLMMTMFILFLSMFVYQASHKEFLVSDEMEVIGGDTTEALDIIHDNGNTFPFVPIAPGRPLMSGGTVKKVEPVNIQDIEADSTFFDEDRNGGLDRIRESFRQAQQKPGPKITADSKEQSVAAAPVTVLPENQEEKEKPRGELPADVAATTPVDTVFTISRDAIAKLGLTDFASIDLVPDQTMRIILTGDLLFDTGQAELNESSKYSLEQIADQIREIPYVINVVGHTDNIPMHSEKYATNWELSVARASTVARFLVEEMNMNPQQFVVSGYSSYRPIRPNTTAPNRAANRRVEIIISKRLPSPVSATAQNLK